MTFREKLENYEELKRIRTNLGKEREHLEIIDQPRTEFTTSHIRFYCIQEDVDSWIDMSLNEELTGEILSVLFEKMSALIKQTGEINRKIKELEEGE